MPRTCTACKHEARLEIERALVTREAYRDIARRFAVSKDALSRHAREHLPDRLKQAHEAEEEGEVLIVAKQLKEINEATHAILKEAREEGRHETALRAIDRVMRQLSLQLSLVEQQEFERRLEELETTLRGKEDAS